MSWQALPKPDQAIVNQLQKELGVSAIIAELLTQRKISSFQEAKDFFFTSRSGSWTAGMQVILYIKCLFGDGNGEWTMEFGW